MTLPSKRTEEDTRTSNQEAFRRLIKERLCVSFQRRRHQLRKAKKKKLKAQYKGSSMKAQYKGKRIVSGYTWTDSPEYKVLTAKTLQREKNASNVITLTGLKIFPNLVGGETIVGNLEVHANGFYYATSNPDFCFSFLYSDVKQAFFRAGDEKTSPILHIDLHQPLNLGIAEKRHDIQFRLVQTPEGQKRSYDDLEKINEDLKNFVRNVGEKFRYAPVFHCLPFYDAEVRKADEFQGKHLSEAPSVFCLTSKALVQLVDEPFVVIDLFEVDMLNLKLKPELSKPVEIDMTVVFEDFERRPFQINSIPVDKLNLIKDKCKFPFAECHVNDCDVEWDSIVKEIEDSPPRIYSDEYEGFPPEYCGPDGRLDMKYRWED